jgi:hypothetical protein
MKRILLLLAAMAALTTGSMHAQPADDLARPVEWRRHVVSEEAGIEFSLRIRWYEGRLQFVAVLTDNKGRVARYFAKYANEPTDWIDGKPVRHSSFHINFHDSSQDFLLHKLYIDDYTFSRTGKNSFASYGPATSDKVCTEKVYRAISKATILLSYPAELETE